MKCANLILGLSAFVCLSSVANANTDSFQKNLESKVNISGPDSVVEKANKNYYSVASPYSEMLQNPLINATLNGYGSMLQGATGGGYSASEQNRQQLDYAKQQIDYSKDNGN